MFYSQINKAITYFNIGDTICFDHCSREVVDGKRADEAWHNCLSLEDQLWKYVLYILLHLGRLYMRLLMDGGCNSILSKRAQPV